jgi:DNA polymerase (family X)
MDNQHYARILSEVAQLMEIKGENRFKIRAFENAARTVETLTESLGDIIAEGRLTNLSGIGKSIAADLEAIHRTGTCSVHTELLEELDPGLLELLRIQGLGPKRIKVLYHELGVKTVEALKAAAQAGQVRTLSGFGQKTEEKILAEIERLAEGEGRMPLPLAQTIGESLRDQLAGLEEVLAIELAGSLRRSKETVGDLDILVASHRPAPISEFFAGLPEVAEVLARGATKTSVRLRSGLQVDLRIVAPEVFGAALHYFTGSKEHHIKLRTRAKRAGLKISEYGVFREGEDTPIASRTEEEVFKALGLAYIAPELRQGRDEIERASRAALPQILETSQVLGDLHMHTVETDGRHTIEEMARAALERGYQYIAITDHSQAVRVANGMTSERFRAQIEQIRTIDRDFENIKILAGIEVDILKDGSLDMDHDLLANCDWVVGSVHSHFNLEPAQMTERLIKAMQTGLISCLGHPTGRILGGRGGYTYDMDAVLEACVEYGVAVEINGSTGRLDFNAEHAEMAHSRGVAIVLGSDAHSTRGLAEIMFAVGQARRAGLEARDVLNALPLDALLGAVRPTLASH